MPDIVEPPPAQEGINPFAASFDAALKHSKPPEPTIAKDPEPKVVPPAKEVEPPLVAKEVPKPATTDPEKGGIKELRESREQAVKEAKELKAQLADFEGTRKERDELKTRFTELEKQNTEFKKLESVAALEQSEPHQRKFVAGRTVHVDRLKELAGYADISADELISALDKRGKDKVLAMDSLLDGASRFVSDDIVQTVKAIEALDAERTKELANASDVMQKRIADRESQSRKERDERARVRTEAWDSVSAKLGKELGITPEQLTQFGDFYKSNKDAGRSAEIVIKGHLADALAAENATLKAELAKYAGATPAVGAGSAGASQEPDDSKLTFTEKVNKEMAKLRS